MIVINKKHKLAFLGASTFALAAMGTVQAQASSVSELAATAAPIANQYGLYPSVMIAQGILESSGGTSELATYYNNIFGVKYTSGTPVDLMTKEFVNGQMIDVVQSFQTYDSFYSACIAQAGLLRSGIYSGAWRENAGSYQEATAWLQGRYATDPQYAWKLNSIIEKYGLTAYDGGGVVASSSPVTPSQGGAGTYTIQAGDSFSSIAAVYGISAQELAAVNGLTVDSLIQPGQVLHLSAAGSSVGGASTSSLAQTSGGAYTVRAGDSFSSIAANYGMTAQALASLNGLTIDSFLQIGDHLTVTGANNATYSESVHATGGTYTIQSGDTLSSIAAAYGLTSGQLASLNGISNTGIIQPGQVINI